MKLLYEAELYCRSPSARTASSGGEPSSPAVYFIRQASDVPQPKLKLGSAGSQAMSPTALSTGSAAIARPATTPMHAQSTARTVTVRVIRRLPLVDRCTDDCTGAFRGDATM